jgi:hypothetical protein
LMWRMKTWVRDGELTIMMRCHTRLKYKEMGELGYGGETERPYSRWSARDQHVSWLELVWT